MTTLAATRRNHRFAVLRGGARIARPVVCLPLLVVLFLCPAAAGQGSEAAVHIVPRVKSRPSPSVSPSLKTHTRPIQVSVDLVLVPVTVTDPIGRIVTGLEKHNFTVYDDKHKQAVRYFSSEDAPFSMGIVLDVSGSMQDKIEEAREAVTQFLRTANPQDEFFLITFSDRPQLLADYTRQPRRIEGSLLYTLPKGRTALLDAIYLALHRLRHAHHRRRAMLVISDGGDNHSRYTSEEVKSVAKEADVQIYGIGIFSLYPTTREEKYGPMLLSDLTDISGGRTFVIENPNELADVATKIGVELRNQYVLGYLPGEEDRDGKWHKIRVKLKAPKGLPPLTVNAKKGYYAASE
jgi:Ca-activated chloride channel family protein